MQQKTKLGINFGFRGWMLLLFEVTAFVLFQSFTQFPLNLLAPFYGGAETLSTLYTVGTLVGIILQLILASRVSKMKSVKSMTMLFGAITLVAALGTMLAAPGTLWLAFYFLVNVFAIMYGMFGIGIIIGQWFPTRKGVFMGIATFAFPVCNGLMGPFAGIVFNGEYMAVHHHPNVFGGFLPFLIVGLIGWLIGLIFIKDYPEQCGCYRDNDKSFTKEKADAMLAAELEAKKTTVWKIRNTLKCGQFWLITIPMGALLGCSVGAMSQTTQIFAANGLADKFGMLMGMVMVVSLIGSYVLGLVDGKWGTKTAITISVIFMLLAGILGAIGGGAMIPGIVCLSIFMGAGSNFTVSGAAQYWRREDFGTVFGYVNPVANVIQCLGVMMFAMLIAEVNAKAPFIATAIIAAISLVCIICFKPAKVKATDDKYRAAVGKTLDDELVGRK